MRWFRRITVLKARRGVEWAPWQVHAPSHPGVGDVVMARFPTWPEALEFANTASSWAGRTPQEDPR